MTSVTMGPQGIVENAVKQLWPTLFRECQENNGIKISEDFKPFPVIYIKKLSDSQVIRHCNHRKISKSNIKRNRIISDSEVSDNEKSDYEKSDYELPDFSNNESEEKENDVYNSKTKLSTSATDSIKPEVLQKSNLKQNSKETIPFDIFINNALRNSEKLTRKSNDNESNKKFDKSILPEKEAEPLPKKQKLNAPCPKSVKARYVREFNLKSEEIKKEESCERKNLIKNKPTPRSVRVRNEQKSHCLISDQVNKEPSCSSNLNSTVKNTMSIGINTETFPLPNCQTTVDGPKPRPNLLIIQDLNKFVFTDEDSVSNTLLELKTIEDVKNVNSILTNVKARFEDHIKSIDKEFDEIKSKYDMKKEEISQFRENCHALTLAITVEEKLLQFQSNYVISEDVKLKARKFFQPALLSISVSDSLRNRLSGIKTDKSEKIEDKKDELLSDKIVSGVGLATDSDKKTNLINISSCIQPSKDSKNAIVPLAKSSNELNQDKRLLPCVGIDEGIAGKKKSDPLLADLNKTVHIPTSINNLPTSKITDLTSSTTSSDSLAGSKSLQQVTGDASNSNNSLLYSESSSKASGPAVAVISSNLTKQATSIHQSTGNMEKMTSTGEQLDMQNRSTQSSLLYQNSPKTTGAPAMTIIPINTLSNAIETLPNSNSIPTRNQKTAAVRPQLVAANRSKQINVIRDQQGTVIGHRPAPDYRSHQTVVFRPPHPAQQLVQQPARSIQQPTRSIQQPTRSIQLPPTEMRPQPQTEMRPQPQAGISYQQPSVTGSQQTTAMRPQQGSDPRQNLHNIAPKSQTTSHSGFQQHRPSVQNRNQSFIAVRPPPPTYGQQLSAPQTSTVHHYNKGSSTGDQHLQQQANRPISQNRAFSYNHDNSNLSYSQNSPHLREALGLKQPMSALPNTFAPYSNQNVQSLGRTPAYNSQNNQYIQVNQVISGGNVQGSSGFFQTRIEDTQSSTQAADLIPNTCFLCGVKAEIPCCGKFVYCTDDCKSEDYERHKTECIARRS